MAGLHYHIARSTILFFAHCLYKRPCGRVDAYNDDDSNLIKMKEQMMTAV